MKLQTKQLKTFNSIAGGMKQNNILPITSYLKFEDGYITKNNMESFVTMEADFKGKCLIDEKILMSIVNATNEETIDVEVKNKSVILSYGNKKATSPTDDLINFPVNDEADIKEIEISKEIINEIKVAANFTSENESLPFTGCVFVGHGIIAACNNFIVYTQKVNTELPEIIIEKNVASAIRNFDTVSFSENNSYRFYTNHIFRFGFVKTETKFVNMKSFSVIPENNNYETVTVNKNEIIEFCEVCVNSCTGRAITASIKGDVLSMVDSAYEIDLKHPMSTKMPDFSFNPILMLKMLKSLPDQELTFIRGKERYVVTGKSGFVSIIMEMQPQ